MGLIGRILFLLAFVTPVAAETVTTENILPNLSQFTTSNSTTSNGGTGNASNGGGTYTSNFDIPLTEKEVQRGFTLNSSVIVDSHASNSVLETCVSVTQAGDCRDLFTLGVTLLDGGTVAGKFSHEVELDFTGERLFSFSDSILENNFGTLTGSFSLYGIDAGYHSGFFGPRFSNPSLTFTYQNLIEQQITDQIVLIDMELAIEPPPPPPAEIESMPAPSTSPTEMQIAAIETEGSAPPPPPSIEMIAAPQQPPEQRQQEAEAEAAVEAELEVRQPEPEVEARAEPEVEARAEPEVAATPRPQTRQQKVKAAAQRVVKKIAPSQRYSAANQTTTLVIMNIIAGKIATGTPIQDTQGFFPRTSIQDNRSMANPLTDYTLFGKSNGAHDAFIQLQWK